MNPDDARTTKVAGVGDCGYCGRRIDADAPASQRFGERFCSEVHAEQFAEGVRAARMKAATRHDAAGSACRLPAAGQRSWKDYLKRGACWGAPLVLLLAIPLIWSGSAWGTAGGSFLSLLALLACPLAMYFMMRAMGQMNHGKRDSGAPGHSRRRE